MRPRRIFTKTDSAKKLYPADAGDRKSAGDDVPDGHERTSISENIRQYLLNSTLHGLRYVGETKISLFER